MARLTLDVRGLYDSNALRNDLLTDLWRGETLTDEERQATQADLKGWNRAGYEAEARLTYTWGRAFFGNSSLRPMISAAHHEVLGMRFTDDVYNLTFFGNAAYEGKIAVLSPTALEQQRYQTLGFGVRSVHRENFLRLDVVNGQYLNAMDLDQGELYTAEDGRYLEADIDGSWHTSDSTGQSFGNNGVGVSLSGGAEFRISSIRLKLRVEDLGFIAWDDDALQLVKDEVVRYDGLYVEDIVDLDGSLLGEAQVRDSLGLNAVSGGYSRALPARFRIAFSRFRRHHGRFRTPPRPEQFTIEQLAVPGYIPRLTYTHSFLLSRHWLGYGSLSYGGFGGLRLGTGLSGAYRWGEVKLDVPNLVGLMFRDAKGRALSFGIAFTL